MNLNEQIKKFGLAKIAIDAGGSIHPLVVPAEITNGTGLMNPSIYLDGKNILVNLRHVNYTLYHSEYKKFQHEYGPLQYLHPENDRNLRTWNYLCILNDDLSIKYVTSVDTTKLDVEPIWEFVGLEDARLVRWASKLYLSGVRRDTTTNGQGRMELSELIARPELVKETKRMRLPAPGADDTYCEKNWMPVLDQPYHYVKWTNPTEVVRYDIDTGTTTTVHLNKNKVIPGVPDFRGGSQVIPYGDYYLALIHEVDLFKSETGEKDAAYKHRFIVWDRKWNIVKYTDAFSFMKADIEFCCGAAFVNNDLLVSFGYQDNCAFILKMPRATLEEMLWSDSTVEFDWGKIAKNPWFHNVVKQELFVDNVYQRYFSVEAGDVVLDLGASVGPFVEAIKDQQLSLVYCLEPEKDLYQTLVKNTKNTNFPVVAVNAGLSDKNGINKLCGMFDENRIEISDGTDGVLVETITFAKLLSDNKITHIDFIKTDCEGAEYDVFNDKYFDWIVSNVKKIAGEFHLHTAEQKAKFKHFRDTYLRRLSNHQVLSMDYVDIKHWLWTDEFIENYSAINLYIDNRTLTAPVIRPVATKLEKWQHWPAPTLEITTIIPEKGCVVDCVFCPQRTLEKVYTGERILTLDNFKKLIGRVPTDVRITFAGFTEPWMNKYCTDMLLHAHDQGHPISVFTTGVGVNIEDLEAVAHVPFAGNPNGGFVLHLPDSEMLARHPITPGYIKTLEWLKENHHRIQNFSTMTMGKEIHPSIRHLFDWAPTYEMWSRAGNLVRESLLKPQLVNLRDRWNAIYHEDKNRTCGCVEHLYHNVLLPNGQVTLCCMDYGLDHVLGNLYEQSYEEVIPAAQSCYDLCNYCENGVTPVEQKVNFYK